MMETKTLRSWLRKIANDEPIEAALAVYAEMNGKRVVRVTTNLWVIQ